MIRIRVDRLVKNENNKKKKIKKTHSQESRKQLF